MKIIALILAIYLFLFPIISAVDFNMSDEFSKGETLLAKVSGNFVEPVLKENIFFYRGHVRISIEPFVSKINDDFYIYSLLPEAENNYSIVISGSKYMAGSKISEENLTKEFTITNSTADFSILPGFVVSDNDFSFKVQNLKDSQITIEITSTTVSGDEDDFSYINSVSLKSGEIKNIDFTLEDISGSTFKLVGFSSGDSSYSIPVNIYSADGSSNTGSNDGDGYIDLDDEDDENQTGNNDSEQKYIPTTTATCDELGGTFCSTAEECDGNNENARDGVCCLATCVEKKESSTGKILGWGLIIAVVLFVSWFLKFKYKGTKKEINLLSFGKKK